MQFSGLYLIRIYCLSQGSGLGSGRVRVRVVFNSMCQMEYDIWRRSLNCTRPNRIITVISLTSFDLAIDFLPATGVEVTDDGADP